MISRLHCDEYMVAWLCALPFELRAAREMLDEEHDTPLFYNSLSDAFDIEYICGRIGQHNVVIAHLPREQIGTYSATTLVEQITSAFRSLRFGLMVGIGGGVPSEEADIRLGDVVVGSPYRTHNGVLQYSSSKYGGFGCTGSLHAPPPVLLDTIANLQAEHKRGKRRLDKYLSKFDRRSIFARESAGPDLLYAAKYDHQGGATCRHCDKSYLVDRKPRSKDSDVVVHYGTIASGDQEMRRARERDELSFQLGGVLCFETEIAGLIKSFPCLVIRGICDYADSHRNERWQEHAAATATAYSKEVLSIISRAEVVTMVTADEAMRELTDSRNVSRRETPQIRQLWEQPEWRREYRNIREFINQMAEDRQITFKSITWKWELPAICAADMKSDVVLVCKRSRTHADSDFAHVHAFTYWEYLKQFKWADFIMETLDILTGVELDFRHGGFSRYAITNPPVWITCSPAKLSINFSYKQTCLEILDLIEVLDWLCKSMRRPTNEEGHVVLSASYHLDHLDHDNIIQGSAYGRSRVSWLLPYDVRPYILQKTSPLPRIEHSCWLSFFDSCVIVDSPFTPNNKFGEGLETSFDLMIALAASEFCLKIKGSLVFLGYRTVLYPVAIHEDCAQFHLITTTQGQINPYTLVLMNILPVVDASQFKTMRCFVGWCEDAHINLGTRCLAAPIKYTSGQNHPKSLISDGYSLLGQFGAAAPLSAILGVQKNFTYSHHRIRFTPTKNYLELLQNTSQQPVVLYDSKQRRCWLVPKLSLLLHMAQRYTSCSAIPYASPHMDAQELISLLEPVGQINVLAGQDHEFKFHELIKALNISMLETTKVLLKSGHEKLYGFEFQDIVRSPDQGSCMKELKILSKRKAWLELVNAVGTVIVCSELGEVISVEGSSTRKCEKCNRVPENEDYITATVPCLSRLAEQKGAALIVGSDCIKFSDKAIWKLTMNPFIPCTHAENSNETCWERPGLIQRMFRRKSLDWKISSKPQSVQSQPVQSPLAKGAVVFR